MSAQIDYADILMPTGTQSVDLIEVGRAEYPLRLSLIHI